MTKMTDAFKKVFLGLGGDPKELAENNDVGDYIVDLEGAIKEYVNEAATHELPTPAETNVGKVATVVSDGEGGYEWDAIDPQKSIVYLDAVVPTGSNTIEITDTRVSNITDVMNLAKNKNYYVCLRIESSIWKPMILWFSKIEPPMFSGNDTITFYGIVTTNDMLRIDIAKFSSSLTGTWTMKDINWS